MFRNFLLDLVGEPLFLPLAIVYVAALVLAMVGIFRWLACSRHSPPATRHDPPSET
jgi:hypothetical protein